MRGLCMISVESKLRSRRVDVSASRERRVLVISVTFWTLNIRGYIRSVGWTDRQQKARWSNIYQNGGNIFVIFQIDFPLFKNDWRNLLSL